jgi:hypothetical protein
MADNPIPKRPHYFRSQYLELRDFDDEQTFHLEMLRRHNRGLHGWGVVRDGLQITTSSDKTGLLITPGSAIDNLGREIVLDGAAVLYFQNNDQQLKWNPATSAYEVSSKDVSAAAGVTGNPLDVYLTISFQESKSDDPNDQYPPPGGTVDVTRMRQTPLLKVEKIPPDDGSSISLARVNVDVGGTLGPPDMAIRPRVGCLGPLYLKTADGKTQFSIDYDSQSDALRVRSRVKDAPSLDATPLTIKRGTGSVGIGTTNPLGPLSIGDASVTDSDGYMVIGKKSSSGTRQYRMGFDKDFNFVIGDYGANNVAGTWTSPFAISYSAPSNSLYIDNSGKVGIGTAIPKGLLDVSGGGAKIGAASDVVPAAGRELVLSPVSGTSAGIVFQHNNVDTVFLKSDSGTRQTTFGANAGTFLAIDNKTGYVGLGAASITHQLTIENKTAAASMRIKSTVGGGDYGLLIGSGQTSAYLATAQPLSLQAGATGIKFLPTGSIGIGTGNDDPNERLDVRTSGPDVAGYLRVSNSDVSSYVAIFPGTTSNQNPAIMWPSVTPFRFGTVGRIANGATNDFVERVRITGDGKVGIGTTNPLGPLSIGDASVTDSDGYMVIGKKSSSGTRQYRMGFDKDFNFVIGDYGANNVAATWTSPFAMFWAAPSNSLYIDKDGKVGFGTKTPGAYSNTNNSYFKASGLGRTHDVFSDGQEAVLILSTSQNKDGGHLGGLYFTRTGGQPDAHREVAGIRCNQVSAGTMAGGSLNFFTKPVSGGTAADAARMVIRENGLVGIGVTNPTQAALVVSGGVNAVVANVGISYFSEQDSPGKINRYNAQNAYNNGYIGPTVSIYATGDIWSGYSYISSSDERIKNIKGRSDGATDLRILLGIEVTDYLYKDVAGKGRDLYKKVIGQQVEKVFPQAVNQRTDVVPDIYRQASIRDGWVALATNLKKGERVKFITEKGEEGIHEVLEVAPDKFRADFKPQDDKVFVFGREVKDFRTVDYDAIAMLNVSATQQLKKEKDEEVKSLQAENAELKARLDALEAIMQRLMLSGGTAAAL